jgi:hypothetical protein
MEHVTFLARWWQVHSQMLADVLLLATSKWVPQTKTQTPQDRWKEKELERDGCFSKLPACLAISS